MKYHLIAIGGSVMHNLAIDLLELGHEVTGSDDEIFEPSRSRLMDKGLFPDTLGWDAETITEGIDVIILGKHAKEDNPELLKALKLKLDIFSFPEFIAAKSNASQVICVSGSHGKTTTTAMIMHVLQAEGMTFDYLVGANLEGFHKMVKLSGADLLVVEGDEYPSSCLDNRAKMLHYKPTISIITGVAWDHVNIYKTYDSYKAIFDTFLTQLPEGSKCFFDQTDTDLTEMVINNTYDCTRVGYLALPIDKKGGVVYGTKVFPINVFGEHNLKNMKAAMLACQEVGVSEINFLKNIASFTGAAKRLETIHKDENLVVYKDFAHAPSKAKATVDAVRQKYKNKKILGILELHTFSSLSIDFLPHYEGCLDLLDKAIVFYDPHALELKKMPSLEKGIVRKSFNHSDLQVSDSSDSLIDITKSYCLDNKFDILLIMSSGNLGNVDYKTIIEIL